jgi:divalent metal cation (Fe/Co/Zn/Cd) transporter
MAPSATATDTRRARQTSRRSVARSSDAGGARKTVLVALLLGIAIAAGGIGLHQLTGRSVFDPVASVLVGLLLIAVAVWMARDTSHLLVGASATREEREAIERVLEDHGDAREVKELLTMVLGPNALLVAARLDLRDDLLAGRVECLADELDDDLRRAVPDIPEVFLDATPGGAS